MSVTVEIKGKEAFEYKEYMTNTNNSGVLNHYYHHEDQVLRLVFASSRACFDWALNLGLNTVNK